MRSILVIFSKELPQKNKKWWEQFDEVITVKELEKFVCSGSIMEAHRLAKEIANLADGQGRKISRLINYKGYDLWWMHFEGLHHEFCLPFTRYRKLLNYLKNFELIYIFGPPHPYLFQYFLGAHNRRCIVLRKFGIKNFLPFSLGAFIQLVLSLGSLFWLKISKPELMIWIGDKFDPPNYFDFRNKAIYKELMGRKVSFVEFIRSLEPWSTVLKHAWQRRRPVIYSGAIIAILHSLAGRSGHFSPSFSASNPEKHFWHLVAAHYLGYSRGTIWSIRVIKFILQQIGVKAAIISEGCDRTFHEILGCKLNDIKTVGVSHGAGNQYYDTSDFMPGFDGKLSLSVDMYGLWSDWWKEHYVSLSRAYQPEQLYVSGPMRPLEKEIVSQSPSFPIKVLFISEDLAVPQQIMPYFSALLGAEDFDLYLKFRPYRDNFELQLKNNYPEVYKRILGKVKILRGTMEEAISQCDVAVGSYSTAVLESLMQLKPFIFFWTEKWGDSFGIKSFAARNYFFADNPRELISCLKKTADAPKDILKQLQKQFFGNPYQNGSKWVVEQALKFSKQKQDQAQFKNLRSDHGHDCPPDSVKRN